MGLVKVLCLQCSDQVWAIVSISARVGSRPRVLKWAWTAASSRASRDHPWARLRASSSRGEAEATRSPSYANPVCGGGNGTSTFDMVAALDQWMTTSKPPSSVPASRVVNGKADRTRPLCPYPQIAVYKGSGSIDEEKNFECRVR